MAWHAQGATTAEPSGRCSSDDEREDEGGDMVGDVVWRGAMEWAKGDDGVASLRGGGEGQLRQSEGGGHGKKLGRGGEPRLCISFPFPLLGRRRYLFLGFITPSSNTFPRSCPLALAVSSILAYSDLHNRPDKSLSSCNMVKRLPCTPTMTIYPRLQHTTVHGARRG